MDEIASVDITSTSDGVEHGSDMMQQELDPVELRK